VRKYHDPASLRNPHQVPVDSYLVDADPHGLLRREMLPILSLRQAAAVVVRHWPPPTAATDAL
jgi:hypothetical protein